MTGFSDVVFVKSKKPFNLLPKVKEATGALMKKALWILITLAATNSFAITNTRAKCQVQGQPDLSFIVVRSETSSQTLYYINGRLAQVAVAQGNWPDEPGILHVLNANNTVKAVLNCDKAF